MKKPASYGSSLTGTLLPTSCQEMKRDFVTRSEPETFKNPL
jgi:hypothetical protein